MTTTPGEGVEDVDPDSAVGFAGLMITAPPEFTDTCCPLIVAAAPGVKVCDPMTTFEEASRVIVWDPTRSGGG